MKEVCLTFIAAVFALSLLMCGTNYLFNCFTEDDWNNGICPTHEVRYELKAAGEAGLKYYACPECGFEVMRH